MTDRERVARTLCRLVGSQDPDDIMPGSPRRPFWTYYIDHADAAIAALRAAGWLPPDEVTATLHAAGWRRVPEGWQIVPADFAKKVYAAQIASPEPPEEV